MLDKWKDVTLNEIKAFLGLCVVMGVNPLPSTADYWSTDPYLNLLLCEAKKLVSCRDSDMQMCHSLTHSGVDTVRN